MVLATWNVMPFLLHPAGQFSVTIQKFVKTFPFLQLNIYTSVSCTASLLFFCHFIQQKNATYASDVWRHFTPANVDGKSLCMCKLFNLEYCQSSQAKVPMVSFWKFSTHLQPCCWQFYCRHIYMPSWIKLHF